LTKEQRVQLVQSALYLNDRQQAATLLNESGGCITLLPEAARDWLQQDNSKLLQRSAPEICLDLLPLVARNWVHDLHLPRSILAASGRSKAVVPSATPDWVQQQEQEQDQTKVLTSPSGTTVTTTLMADDGDDSHNSFELSDSKVDRQLFAELNLPATGSRKEAKEEADTAVNSNDERSKEEGTCPQETQTPDTNPPLPHEVMGSIMKDMVMQRGKQYLNALPTGNLQKTGMVAAAFLLIQFRYSRRARQTFWGVLQGSSTLCMSSILAGCIGAVTAKHCYGERSVDQESLSESSPLSISVSTIQEVLRRAGVMGSKWKEVLAVLIVSYFGRRHRQARGA
jgi:hypothetical protein